MSVEPGRAEVVDATAAPRVRWGAVGAFVALALGLAWLVALPLWLGEGLASPLAAPLLTAMMFTPTIAALIVMFAFRAPRAGRLRFLGMWPLRPAGRFVLFLVIGLFAPILLVAATVAVAAALGWVRLDLVGFSGFAAQLDAVLPPGTALPPIGVLVAVQLASIPIGALVNSIFAAGEELGWRGWLQTALRPLGVWPALLLTGAIWGLWHAPVILLGYNFGRPDAVGLLLMVGGCLAWGVLLGWMRLRCASVWPAALAHGCLNAVAGAVLLVAAAGPAPDMALAGPLGVAAWIVLAVVVGVLSLTGQFRRDRLEPVRSA